MPGGGAKLCQYLNIMIANNLGMYKLPGCPVLVQELSGIEEHISVSGALRGTITSTRPQAYAGLDSTQN